MTTFAQRQPSAGSTQTLINSGLSPLIARLLASRGIDKIEDSYLEIGTLLSPEGLLGIDSAAEHLADAIMANKHMVIIADYDCDGATACAVGLKGLRSFGAHVDFLVPNRFEYGYGLSPEIVQLAANHPDFSKPDLLITVDNGMASIAGVALANQLGMPVIITDHHLPADETPDALAIVNPNQHGCTFSSKNLAGVGVMFYVLINTRAVLKTRGYFDDKPIPNLSELLDLVALGTVADVVKLDHNNRVLVANGLKRMRAGKMSAGIGALLKIAGRDYTKTSTFDLGFAVGPRLNAAGRIDDMSLGIRCLISDNHDEAMRLAQQLDEMNRERKAIEQQMREDAEVNLSALSVKVQHSICLTHEDFHQGVIGIVAGRLKEKYHRPTIVFAPDGKEFLKGSGRSINGIHLRDVLDRVDKNAPDTIVKFGGHAMAAGLTIVRESFETFKQTFEQAVLAMSEPEVFTKQIMTDGEPQQDDLTIVNVDAINQQVWGQGFPAPLFEGQFTVLEQRILKDAHLKLKLQNAHGIFNAIWFFHAQELPRQIHCAYQLQRNDWNGNTELQFLIEHAYPLEEHLT
ncbi:single-stranded-DNA-specific exonuclease [Formosimonas limnophila]|uniref:Single-stranded-DNA-specific exonuclease RecJ n=1 Tax=Formosimonas limnophila TaxID=1384487 RepID=A0A8J3CLU7_9BURK|nr:single-stranded-DNA-specific exonuclease RecJ [Formosimonas limnophila]GHA67307.1 single-stranded-DNA-specific exonuclease [Formosimonas limnophila]